MSLKRLVGCAVVIAVLVGSSANAAMFITEWAYNGSEFVEFTNIGGPAIDMNGWSFDDDSRTPGSVDLSVFGIVAPQQSVILSEESDATFHIVWGLPASVKVIGGNSNNLGRADELNLYNGTTLVDRLTFGDQAIPGTIRTDINSGNPITLAALGANAVAQWKLSANADVYGSYASISPNPGHLGNPGKFALVPEPASFSLALAAVVGGLAARRKR